MNIKEAIEKDPLFTKYPKTKENLELFLNFDNPLDFYCPSCERDSVFNSQTTGRLTNTNFNLIQNFVIRKFYRCTRNSNHLANIEFITNDDNIVKIGQYPSNTANLKYGIEKYRKHFEEDYLELRRAFGLSDHDVGVGASIYLRRIFERCIVRASKRKDEDVDDWQAETIKNLRMNDKISELSGYLPEFITKNKVAYGILSRSIHELTEEECLANFNLLAESIQLILDQEMELITRFERQQKLSKELNELNE